MKYIIKTENLVENIQTEIDNNNISSVLALLHKELKFYGIQKFCNEKNISRQRYYYNLQSNNPSLIFIKHIFDTLDIKIRLEK